MNLLLQRTAESVDGPTFGTITDADSGVVVVPVTLELPDRGNQPDVSRVVAGTYECARFDSPHIGYELFQLQNVPNRSGVDIHVGNVCNDTKGCILVGMSRDTLGGQPSIGYSADAFARFMRYLTGVDTFTLAILDVPSASADN